MEKRALLLNGKVFVLHLNTKRLSLIFKIRNSCIMWRNLAKFPRVASWSNGGGLLQKRHYSRSEFDVVILEPMKLRRYRYFARSKEPLSGLEPLKTFYHELDLIQVRFKQPNVLFLRSELILQRLEYLKPSGLLPRQKRKLIERSPPVVVFTEDHKRRTVNYLRGLIRTQKDGVTENAHLFHPCVRMISMSKRELDGRLKTITEELRMAQQSALKMLLELPCFLLHNTEASPEKCVVLHKYDLPAGYNVDNHTAHIYPPILSTGLELNPRLFRRDSDEALAKKFPKLFLGDLLDYSYPTHHGRGRPEDLTEFLIGAERRELRPKYNRII